MFNYREISPLSNGEVIQTFVQYKSLILERVGNNFYLRENGNTLQLGEISINTLLQQLEENECNNPLSAALFIMKVKDMYLPDYCPNYLTEDQKTAIQSDCNLKNWD